MKALIWIFIFWSLCATFSVAQLPEQNCCKSFGINTGFCGNGDYFYKMHYYRQHYYFFGYYHRNCSRASAAVCLDQFGSKSWQAFLVPENQVIGDGSIAWQDSILTFAAGQNYSSLGDSVVIYQSNLVNKANIFRRDSIFTEEDLDTVQIYNYGFGFVNYPDKGHIFYKSGDNAYETGTFDGVYIYRYDGNNQPIWTKRYLKQYFQSAIHTMALDQDGSFFATSYIRPEQLNFNTLQTYGITTLSKFRPDGTEIFFTVVDTSSNFGLDSEEHGEPKPLIFGDQIIVNAQIWKYTPPSFKYYGIFSFNKYTGKLNWKHVTNNSISNDKFFKVIALADGNLLCIGSNFTKDYHGVLKKLDSQGNLIWQKRYQDTVRFTQGGVEFYDAVELPNRKIALCGNVYLNGTGLGHEALFMTVDSNGCYEKDCSEFIQSLPEFTKVGLTQLDTLAFKLKVFPNPSAGGQNESLQIDVQYLDASLFGSIDVVIVDLSGVIVHKFTMTQLTSSATLDISKLASGVYGVQLRQRNRVLAVEKLVVVR
jgi:hypothetical protein